ncbi:MAG: pantoate--beta-alanine ligase [Betaproteobacteria bacterium]
MKVIESIAAWRSARKEFRPGSVGFVPTMGALHEGHAALLRRAADDCEISVLSIFVNPAQFNDPQDLAKYPRTLDQDLEVARREGVDFMFLPDAPSMYHDGYRYQVTENTLSRELCGVHRPGHFDGVLSVVLKLFQLVKPDRAYFGEKDYQQLELVRGMAGAFFLDLEIVAVATVREADGLAMSSRNARLTPAQRAQAPVFPEILRSSPDAAEAAQRLEAFGFDVDYVEDRPSRRFGAVKLGDVRLIDNVPQTGI